MDLYQITAINRWANPAVTGEAHSGRSPIIYGNIVQRVRGVEAVTIYLHQVSTSRGNDLGTISYHLNLTKEKDMPSHTTKERKKNVKKTVKKAVIPRVKSKPKKKK